MTYDVSWPFRFFFFAFSRGLVELELGIAFWDTRHFCLLSCIPTRILHPGTVSKTAFALLISFFPCSFFVAANYSPAAFVSLSREVLIRLDGSTC